MERTMLPPGTYNAVAALIRSEAGDEAYVQFGNSREKGTPQVCINFEITDGDYAGHRIAWMGYFTEKTTKRTFETLRLVGWKGDDLMGALAQELTNQVSLVVDHEEWDGKVRAKIKWVNPPGGGGLRINTMNANDLRSFAASMKVTAKSIPEVDGKKAEPRTPPPFPSQSADPADDINKLF
jgi:hypothetical protein